MFNSTLAPVLEMLLKDVLESLPKEFMKPSKNRNTISFTTTDMVGGGNPLFIIINIIPVL